MDNINKQFYNYLWAYILVALSGCLGNVVDGIIVGNLISEDGVSAINLSKPINQFIFTLHLLINAGAGMLVAYALWNKNIGEAKRLFTRAFMLSIGLGVLLAVFGGIIFPDETAQLLCSNKQILPLANEYMRILLLGNPAFILMWGLSTMVGVDGSPKLVSVAVIIDNAVNLFLDIVLSHWVNPEHRRLTLDFSFDNLPSSWRRIVSQGAPLAIASISLTLLLLSANTIVLNTLGRTGIFAFAVCMNLLQVYNLFLSGTCQTLQSLGAIQVGKGDNEGLHLILRKAFRFITVAMAITCLFVWISPTTIVRLFGTNEPAFVSEGNYALRIFALSFIPFCYIYVLMIVYKLYHHHHMALFISFALSLTVIPVLWIMSSWFPNYLWYSYLLAYIIEGIAIFAIHRATHVKFEL